MLANQHLVPKLRRCARPRDGDRGQGKHARAHGTPAEEPATPRAGFRVLLQDLPTRSFTLHILSNYIVSENVFYTTLNINPI